MLRTNNSCTVLFGSWSYLTFGHQVLGNLSWT